MKRDRGGNANSPALVRSTRECPHGVACPGRTKACDFYHDVRDTAVARCPNGSYCDCGRMHSDERDRDPLSYLVRIVEKYVVRDDALEAILAAVALHASVTSPESAAFKGVVENLERDLTDEIVERMTKKTTVTDSTSADDLIVDR